MFLGYLWQCHNRTEKRHPTEMHTNNTIFFHAAIAVVFKGPVYSIRTACQMEPLCRNISVTSETDCPTFAFTSRSD